MVGFPDPVKGLRTYPFELSGGLRQRSMIVMALICRPTLLVADEPTTALDVTIQAQILKMVRDLQDELGMAMLMITHDLGVVAKVCDRVAVMYAGQVVEYGSIEELYDTPRHPYTQGLLRSIPHPEISVAKLAGIPGHLPNLLDPPAGCRFQDRCAEVMPVCKTTPASVSVGGSHTVACHLIRQGGGDA